jgi:hypothetical protein
MAFRILYGALPYISRHVLPDLANMVCDYARPQNLIMKCEEPLKCVFRIPTQFWISFQRLKEVHDVTVSFHTCGEKFYWCDCLRNNFNMGILCGESAIISAETQDPVIADILNHTLNENVFDRILLRLMQCTYAHINWQNKHHITTWTIEHYQVWERVTEWERATDPPEPSPSQEEIRRWRGIARGLLVHYAGAFQNPLTMAIDCGLIDSTITPKMLHGELLKQAGLSSIENAPPFDDAIWRGK